MVRKILVLMVMVSFCMPGMLSFTDNAGNLSVSSIVNSFAPSMAYADDTEESELDEVYTNLTKRAKGGWGKIIAFGMLAFGIFMLVKGTILMGMLAIFLGVVVSLSPGIIDTMFGAIF